MSYESILNKKEVRCRFCDKIVKFVETEKEYIECKTKPTMWGFMLICPKCNFEGEVKHCYVKLKDGSTMNFQDFLSDETSVFSENFNEEIFLKELDSKLADRIKKIKKINKLS